MGLGDWLKKRFSREAPEHPVAAFDRRLETLGARGAALRRSAATLLAARGDLERAAAEAEGQANEIAARLEQARVQDRTDVAEVLQSDLERARSRAIALRAELERIEEDAKAIAQTVREVEGEAESLRRERAAASARLVASQTAARALRHVGERFDEVLALDQARDEIERAHALAELCREDLASRRRE